MKELSGIRAELPQESIDALNLELIAEMRADRLAGRTPKSLVPRASDAAEVQRPERAPEPEDASTRELILDILQSTGDPMPTSDITAELTARGLPTSPQNLGNHFAKLIETGQITRVARGTYQAVFDVEVLADRTLVNR